MENLFILFYIFCGSVANSYVKHNIFGIRTVYIFNMKNFLLEKLVYAFMLGWISIPIAIIHSLFIKQRT